MLANSCADCGKPISPQSKRCRPCNHAASRLGRFDQAYVRANSTPNEVGCWIWRSTDRNGYALAAGGESSAYRLAYRLWKGPIPFDHDIDHRCHPETCAKPCRHRACVNPDHLEAVTQRVNNRRSGNPFGQNARKTECDKGHPLTPGNFYSTSRGGRRCKICHADERRARRARQRASQSALRTPAGPAGAPR